MKKELIAHKDPKSPVSEVFRTLRTNIQFMNTTKQLETLLVVSTLPGEGKSWVTANLAVTFAQAGKRVILVDADMRKGRQYSIFEVSPRPGLSNYLSGIDMSTGENATTNLSEYIQETEIDNLHVIAAGNVPPNPSELLISTRMAELLEKLKGMCDIVIIDGTPCELVTDSIILTRLVDSTVIVTAYKETKRDNLKKIVNNIQNVGGKIAGVVFNKVPVSAKKYEESYYYGSTTMPMKVKKNNSMNFEAREEMKRRVRPENPQSIRENEERKNREEKIEDKETLQRQINIENADNISMEKINDIMNQMNTFLDNEKKNLNEHKE